MTIRKELLDQLLANYEDSEDLIGPDGLLKQLTAALVERALQAEVRGHLGYEKHDPAGRGTADSRNGDFDPKLVKKWQTHFDGCDDSIRSMYACGMSTREIQGHLQELYGVEVSPDLVSRVTDAVIDEVRFWQNRPLDRVYPIVILDALVVKIRDGGGVQNKSVYIALAIDTDGQKDVLGM